MRTRDAIVAGGGIIGCSIAWQLAERGLTVTIIEPGAPGGGATWASAGMLSPLAEAEALEAPGSSGRRAFGALASASFERWPAYAEAVKEASGLDVGYRTDGKLHVALDEDALHDLDPLVSAGAAFGVERLTGSAARALEPSLSEHIAGALFVARDHRVDNRRCGEAAWRAAEGAGVDIVRDRVVDISAGRSGTPAARSSGGVRVRSSDGSVLAAGSVVIAAGAWSGGIGGLPTSLPVRPVRGQMFSLAADAASDRVARIVETADCYLVPREERLLVGATVEEVGWRQGPTPAGLAMLAAAAARVVPATAEAAIVESWAGFRPGTPDDLPILGRDPDMPDVLYATGHFRNGILLAPITAAAIADLLTGRAAVADLAPFGVARFRSTDA